MAVSKYFSNTLIAEVAEMMGLSRIDDLRDLEAKLEVRIQPSGKII